MKKYFTLLFFGLLSLVANAQSDWRIAISEPNPRRFDDVFFLNNELGWALTTTNDLRKLYHTSDGGQYWYEIKNWTEQQMGYARSVRFFDAQNGVLGSLGGRFFRTSDGGLSWDTIHQHLVPRPTAICGLFRLNDSVMYAVGDYAVNAYIYKTTDKGQSWTWLGAIPQATNLIDAYFTDENNGWVTGRANPADSGAVLLRTTDGGQSWQTVLQSGRAGDLGWKIFFTQNKQQAYVTVQARNVPEHYFFKSVDGGQSWAKKTIALGGDSVWFIQGMAFTNAGRGWAGGHFFGHITSLDSGESWQYVTGPGTGFNRFWQKPNGQLYVGGRFLYELDSALVPLSVAEMGLGMDHQLRLFPNPVRDRFTVQVDFKAASLYHIYIIDQQGRRFYPLAKGKAEQAGRLSFVGDATAWPAGWYVVVLETDAGSAAVKLLVE